MHALRILPLLSIALIFPAVGQTITDATKGVLPVARDDGRDDGRVVARPPGKPVCPEYLEGCLRDDKSRALLFLGVMSAGKRPLVLR